MQLTLNYSLENNFSSCPLVQSIRNPDYIFQSSGVFTDEETMSYRENILKFSSLGIIDGYEDGSFQAQREITRSEFLKVALASHCYEYTNEDPSDLRYIDVDQSSWQARVIKKAESL